MLLTQGNYGARTTTATVDDIDTSVFHVAAPIVRDGRTIGVLSLAKATSAIAPFVERAERRFLPAAPGCWPSSSLALRQPFVDRERRAPPGALMPTTVDAGRRTAVPALPGELGKLARPWARCANAWKDALRREHRPRTDSRAEVPIAAIRGAGGTAARKPMNDRGCAFRGQRGIAERGECIPP